MKKELPNVIDRYAVLFVIGAVFAVNFAPWFLEPFGMLLTEPGVALRLIFGRLLFAGFFVALFIAIRRYGWVSTALFFLNPTLALGWVRTRRALADKLTDLTSGPAPQRGTDSNVPGLPAKAPWVKAENESPAATQRATEVGAPLPVRTSKTRHVSDLGPKRGDRFAESPIHTCRRGFFG